MILLWASDAARIIGYIFFVLWFFGRLLKPEFRPKWLSYWLTANDGLADTRGLTQVVVCFIFADVLYQFAQPG